MLLKILTAHAPRLWHMRISQYTRYLRAESAIKQVAKNKSTAHTALLINI